MDGQANHRSLRRLVRRLTGTPAPEQPRQAEDTEDGGTAVRLGGGSVSGSSRQLIVVTGSICSVAAAVDIRQFVVDIDDGSRIVTVIWMGRRELRGIGLGTKIRVAGRLGAHRSGLVIYNPDYVIIGA